MKDALAAALQSLSAQTAANLTATEKVGAAGVASINQTANENHVAVVQAQHDIGTAIQATAGAAALALAMNSDAIKAQNASFNSALQSALCVGFGSVNSAIAQGVLTITSKQEMCCCDVKTTLLAAVKDDGETTRALIAGIDRDRLTANLVTSKDEVTALKAQIAMQTAIDAALDRRDRGDRGDRGGSGGGSGGPPGPR